MRKGKKKEKKERGLKRLLLMSNQQNGNMRNGETTVSINIYSVISFFLVGGRGGGRRVGLGKHKDGLKGEGER